MHFPTFFNRNDFTFIRNVQFFLKYITIFEVNNVSFNDKFLAVLLHGESKPIRQNETQKLKIVYSVFEMGC